MSSSCRTSGEPNRAWTMAFIGLLRGHLWWRCAAVPLGSVMEPVRPGLRRPLHRRTAPDGEGWRHATEPPRRRAVPRRLTDDLGAVVGVDRPPRRVVSLVPSLTEALAETVPERL